MVTPVASKTGFVMSEWWIMSTKHCLFSWLDILSFCRSLVTRAAWVSFVSEFLIKCVGTSRSFLPHRPFSCAPSEQEYGIRWKSTMEAVLGG